QTPKFSLDTHGFQSEEEYLEFKDTMGNLTLLEKSINSSVKNRNILEKISFYDKSKFKMTKLLATEITYSNQFNKKDIEART
ncbi:HNH endonuclease family protein, partial [Brevibacterium sp. SIMBA_078]